MTVMRLADLVWDNSFTRELPADESTLNRVRQVHGAAYSRVMPTPTEAPTLIATAAEMLEMLGLDSSIGDDESFVRAMTGNTVTAGMDPHAMCYGGHQFGSWAGQLGDGRAITLGEVPTAADGRQTLQLKGAGPTPYSRTADGLAVLRSSIREFLCSEAMHHLGVPTTRALSVALTGDKVMRDMFYDGRPALEQGAVVCRVAPSFIRFGNFEIFAARDDIDNLRRLADYTIAVYFPELVDAHAADSSSGTVSNGNVSNGNVSNGNVSIGKVSSGTVSNGNVSIGNVSIGTVSNGNVSIGNVSTGKVSISNVSTGNVSTGNVSTGNVSTGNVSTGNVSTGNVSTGNVSTGNVSTGNVSTGNVSTGNVSTGNVSISKVSKDVYVDWLAEIAQRTADMIVHWQRVGFVHGVMNTDNMSIHGLTIDYGPYGWLEDYDPGWTPNTTDASMKRYRFGAQPHVARWNVERLANAIYPLVEEVEPLENALNTYVTRFNEQWPQMMSEKLGITDFNPELDQSLIDGLASSSGGCAKGQCRRFGLSSSGGVCGAWC